MVGADTQRRPALSQEDCPHCPTPRYSRLTGAIEGRTGPLRGCPHYWEHRAIEQAKVLNRQAEHIRELLAERDDAATKAEAAYDLAEQYAREAGRNITRDGVLRYVAQYWEMRGQFERRCSELEAFHRDVHGLTRDLEEGIFNGAAAATPGKELAERIIARVRAVNPYTGRQKAGELFRRPEAPRPAEMPLPFGEVA